MQTTVSLSTKILRLDCLVILLSVLYFFSLKIRISFIPTHTRRIMFWGFAWYSVSLTTLSVSWDCVGIVKSPKAFDRVILYFWAPVLCFVFARPNINTRMFYGVIYMYLHTEVCINPVPPCFLSLCLMCVCLFLCLSVSYHRFSDIQAHSSVWPAIVVGGGWGPCQQKAQQRWKIARTWVSRSENVSCIFTVMCTSPWLNYDIYNKVFQPLNQLVLQSYFSLIVLDIPLSMN